VYGYTSPEIWPGQPEYDFGTEIRNTGKNPLEKERIA
jgi:hypothetical protein